MQLVFIDDSGQTRPVRQHLGELVAMGAVMVPEESVASYAQDLAAIKAELQIPADEEIKWNPPKNSRLAAAGREVVAALRQRMLNAAIQRGVRTAVVVWDRGHVGWSSKSIADEILKYLYERIEMHLGEYDQRGVVIADVPGGGAADHSKWLAAALDLTTIGTRFVKPERVIMPIVTAPSHHVPHLQLADVVTAATTAAIAGRKSGLALVPLLKQLARTNSRGYIGGAGLVLFPPDLQDLYYWLLDEPVYFKAGSETRLGPTGDPFSTAGRTYQNSDGMPETETSHGTGTDQ